MDITPATHMLLSMANQTMTWPKAIAELIDNGFDAGANRVVVVANGRSLLVEDDGRGAKDMRSLFKIGEHTQTETTCLGTYGIGLKDCWLHCGGVLDVSTVRNGMRTHLKVDPRHIIASGQWQCDDPITEPTTDASGTVIKIGLKDGRNRPSIESLTSLSWVFTPALQQGKQILVSCDSKPRKPLKAMTIPPLSDVVRDEFAINGKSVNIEIGILADGQTINRGPFWVAFKHRNIVSSSLGAKSYSTQRLGGVITLGDGWVLTKNKDDLSDYRDELEDAVFERIESLLIKAEKLSEDIESSVLKHEIEGLINSGITKLRKECRPGKAAKQNVALPAFTGRKRRKAAVAKEGDGNIEEVAKRVRRGFSIDWYTDPDDPRAGEFDAIGHRVKFNLENEFVYNCKADSNTLGLYAVGIAILTNHSCSRDDKNNLLLVPLSDFNSAYGTILSSVGQQGDRNAKSA